MPRKIFSRLLSIGIFALSLFSRSINAVVLPDTLDLARHADLALNGTTDQRGEFMFRCSISPPTLAHDAYSFPPADRNTLSRGHVEPDDWQGAR